MYRSLAARLDAADTFLKDQNHYSAFLVELANSVPNSVTLKDVLVDDAAQASVQGTSSSYADISGFFNKLKAAGGEAPYFSQMSLATINREDQSKQIQFNIKLKIDNSLLKASTKEAK